MTPAENKAVTGNDQDDVSKAPSTSAPSTPAHQSGEAEKPENRSSRIIVKVEEGVQARTAIKEAVQLATSLQVSLMGRYIEDDALLSSAALPFTWEISRSGQKREITPVMLADDIAKEAEQAHLILQEITHGSEVDWSFEKRQGEPLEELVHDAEREDLLVLAAPDLAHQAEEISIAHMLRAATTQSHLDVMLVGHLTPPPDRGANHMRHQPIAVAPSFQGGVLSILEQLEDQHLESRPLFVVDDGSSQAEICFHIAQQLALVLGMTVRRLVVTTQDAAEIASALRRRGAGLALFPAGCKGLKYDTDATRIARHAGCAVLFLTADHSEGALF
ncbi:MAG: hypothetical protein KUG59_02550 [Parvibaculaceae bacterium]|nr:hypothetical protein [Parvibaculaceae bacterium]